MSEISSANVKSFAAHARRLSAGEITVQRSPRLLFSANSIKRPCDDWQIQRAPDFGPAYEGEAQC
jgi:hypothetical protein